MNSEHSGDEAGSSLAVTASLPHPEIYYAGWSDGYAEGWAGRLIAMEQDEALPAETIDALAKIIDPHSFKAWQAVHDYGLRNGESEAESIISADYWHAKQVGDARDKARQILAAMVTLPNSRKEPTA